MIVVLSNKDDSRALLLEAERQRLTDGDFVFFLLQHFEVSEPESVFTPLPDCLSACSCDWSRSPRPTSSLFTLLH